jgi:hypothetical protein
MYRVVKDSQKRRGRKRNGKGAKEGHLAWWLRLAEVMSGCIAISATGDGRKSVERLLVVGLAERYERGDMIAEATGASDAIYICPPGNGLGPGPATGLRMGMYKCSIARSWSVRDSLRANSETIRPPPATRMKQEDGELTRRRAAAQ